GKVLSTGSGVKLSEVVGVVGDVHSTQLENDPTLLVYAPYWKLSHQVSALVVRSASAGGPSPEEVRRAIQSIDSAIPAPKMRTMADIVNQSVTTRRFQMDVAVAFAASALLLAALGIYGVVAYSIALRRRELGIRLALGARSGQVRAFVVWQGLRPVVSGLVAGMVVALAAGSLIRSLLFGVSPFDERTLGTIAVLLLTIAVVAC